jgi:hypothetical protein
MFQVVVMGLHKCGRDARSWQTPPEKFSHKRIVIRYKLSIDTTVTTYIYLTSTPEDDPLGRVEFFTFGTSLGHFR